MKPSDGDQLPPGRQPYDSLTGLRVGAIAGGLLGAVAAVVLNTPWLILVGAVIGAASGYQTERRKVRDETRDLRSDGPDTMDDQD